MSETKLTSSRIVDLPVDFCYTTPLYSSKKRPQNKPRGCFSPSGSHLDPN